MLPSFSTLWVDSQEGWFCSWSNPRSAPFSALRSPGLCAAPCTLLWVQKAALCLLLLLSPQSSLRAPSQALHLETGRRGKHTFLSRRPPQSCSYATSAMLPPALPVPQNSIFQHRGPPAVPCGPKGSGKMGISLSKGAVLRLGWGEQTEKGLVEEATPGGTGDLFQWRGNSQVSISFFQELVFVGADSSLFWPPQE